MQDIRLNHLNSKNSDHHAARMCPSCSSDGMQIFYQIDNVPVHSVLNITSRGKARSFPRADLCIGFCRFCGFIGNTVFDAELLQYSPDCEESQGYSPTFNRFLQNTADYLIEKYGLYDKDILEIGCGKGEFLTLLCERGNNRGVGFDPAYVSGRTPASNNLQITFVKDYYSPEYADCHADFICCRMTLEHISDPANFVDGIRHAIGSHAKTIVFFQVPDVTRILIDCAFEDIYYEHCSYFSPGSLARLFRQYGFEILNLNTDYAGQYILLEAATQSNGNQPVLGLENDLNNLKLLIAKFGSNCQRKLDEWRTRLQDFQSQGKRTVLWGSGSKGVAFLTTLEVQTEIGYVVDINRFRQGTYMAGTGHLIVAPSFLRDYRPDIVIIMNPVYQEEVRQELYRMDLFPQIMTL